MYGTDMYDIYEYGANTTPMTGSRPEHANYEGQGPLYNSHDHPNTQNWLDTEGATNECILNT